MASSSDGSPTTGIIDLAPDATPIQRAVIRLVLGALKVSARVTPKPTALAIRKLFQRTGGDTAATLRRHAPVDVVVVPDEPVGIGSGDVIDIYLPARGARPGMRLPVVVWVHGGAFVGGSKEELAGWFRLLADAGFCVVAPRYTLAPEGCLPEPARQVMAALAHLGANADRFHADLDRVVVAGDSAGANIAAQCAALLTNPAYAAGLGVTPTIEPAALRGTVLCCGIYDPTAGNADAFFTPFLDAVMWAYSGVRRWRTDEQALDALIVGRHVTADFPPTFVTAGNADPLEPQSRTLIAWLEAHGVAVDTLLYPADHTPPLDHEYQFRLDTADARTALDRIVAFLHARTAVGPAA